MRICITTVADGAYQRYIPLWALCVLRAYPDYAVRVFVRDDPGPQLQQGMALLEYAGDFEVITKALRGYRKVRRLGAFLRFLLFTEKRQHYWEPFDYVYITDADMLMVRQEPSLHEQHIAHMEAIGLPYSDVMRDGEPRIVTGLLFASQAFITGVMISATMYDQEFRLWGEGVLDTGRRIPDERLLYQIIRDSPIGLPPQHDAEADPLGRQMSDPANYRERVFRPWHGINIGADALGGYAASERPHWPFMQEAVQQIDALLEEPLAQACYRLMDERQQRLLTNIITATKAAME